MVSLTQEATIRANNIYDNGLLGIDLGGNGVTPNDCLLYTSDAADE